MVHCSLGRLNYGGAFLRLFESSSIQSSDERIEASQVSMAIFECKMSVQIGEGLTCAKCLCEVVISGSMVQLLH